jgi:type II secretory pathway pseudopilin PulG
MSRRLVMSFPSMVASRRKRSGATLTEVLMSLLIMGLGITSVFTLFPMSVLRSVKATNLTNATLLSQSARDLFYANRGALEQVPLDSSYGAAQDVLLSTAPIIQDADIPDPFYGTYVIDPYGGYSAPDYGSSPGAFGEETPGDTSDHWGVHRVANGLGIDNVTAADSWVTEFEGQPTGVAAAGLTFANTGIGNSVTDNTRLLILSADLRRSITRRATGSATTTQIDSGTTSGDNIGFVTPTHDLPAGFDTIDEIGLVRVQNFERRYTWLATIHQPETGLATGQIAVFFRRGFGESEQLFEIANGSIDIKQQRVTVNNYNLGEPAAGDYVFGTWIETTGGVTYRHGRWYRLAQVRDLGDVDGDSLQTSEYQLTLDRPWTGKTGNANMPHLMFPKGVISVFDLY